MKQLTCEMCGSTDLIKQDGVFVCQTCGCKYSVEEAKKMMVEGIVDVQGTVKVDNSAFVEKYLANARRAKMKEDWEETEKYYNMVEQNDPNNIEAIFYSAYGKAMGALIDSDIYKRGAAFKVLRNSISVIDDNYQAERREENKNAILSMCADLKKLIRYEFVYNTTKTQSVIFSGVTYTSDDTAKTFNLFFDLLIAFRESVKNICDVDDHRYLHVAMIDLFNGALATGRWKFDSVKTKLMEKWVEEEKKKIHDGTVAYWIEHADEKAKLDRERQLLVKRISDLEAYISSFDSSTIRQKKAELKALNAELNAVLAEGKKPKSGFDLNFLSVTKSKSTKKFELEQKIKQTQNAIEALTEENLRNVALEQQQQLKDAKAKLHDIKDRIVNAEW